MCFLMLPNELAMYGWMNGWTDGLMHGQKERTQINTVAVLALAMLWIYLFRA